MGLLLVAVGMSQARMCSNLVGGVKSVCACVRVCDRVGKGAGVMFAFGEKKN